MDDIKLCVVVDTPEGRDALLRDRLEQWALRSFMRFNNYEWKVLYLGCSTPNSIFQEGRKAFLITMAHVHMGILSPQSSH